MRSIKETINALKNGEYDDKLTYLYSCDKNDVEKYSDRYIDVINGFEETFGKDGDIACFLLLAVQKSAVIIQTISTVVYLREVLILMLYLPQDQTVQTQFVFNQEIIRLTSLSLTVLK